MTQLTQSNTRLTNYGLGFDIGLAELESLPTPAPEKNDLGVITHQTVPHSDVIKYITESANNIGIELSNFTQGTTHDHNRMFGICDVYYDKHNADYKSIIAYRNSHDKKFPVALAGGSRITVCSNLIFSGEIVVKTRHTKNIFLRLPNLILKAVEQLKFLDDINDQRIEAYKSRKVESDSWVHDFCVRACDAGVLSPSNLYKVLNEWRMEEGSQSSTHDEFKPRTLWSLNNAFTESFKCYKNLDQVTTRNIKLCGMMDNIVNLDTRSIIELSDDEFETMPVSEMPSDLSEQEKANLETEALLEEMETV